MANMTIARRRRQRPLVERLAERTDKSGGPDACWIWTGSYGQYNQPCMWQDNKTASVRRVVWELETKSKPEKHRLVTVTCGDSRCVNPKHLALRTVIDLVAKFWEKVDRRGPNECWLWTGNTNKTGYGRHYRNKTEFHSAHRFSYELHHGPIEGHVPGDPEREICVLHRCDTPRCVNPSHLFLGSDKDNIRDCIAKGRTAWQRARSNMVAACNKAMRVPPIGTEGTPK
jgi:hypothetical protein